MSRDWRSYLADIRTACEKVAKFTAGMDREAFFADDRAYHAVVHCLLIVGEAAKRIPEDVQPSSRWIRSSRERSSISTYTHPTTSGPPSAGAWPRNGTR